MLPHLSGRPIRVEIRGSLGPHHAATHIPRRRILLDAGLLARHGEFERILIHEIFHFVWVRLSNVERRSWECLLAGERAGKVRGELGWSAEWRKDRLKPSDVRQRTRGWRHYICESFCDTSAWVCAGLRRHDEFTLAAASRRARKRWFRDHLMGRGDIPV